MWHILIISTKYQNEKSISGSKNHEITLMEKRDIVEDQCLDAILCEQTVIQTAAQSIFTDPNRKPVRQPFLLITLDIASIWATSTVRVIKLHLENILK